MTQDRGSDGTVDIAVVSIRPSQPPVRGEPRPREERNENSDADERTMFVDAASNTLKGSERQDHGDFARPALRRRRAGRPKGPPAQRITYELHREDAELFRDLCDDAWDGCTYKEGFRRLLTLAGVRPGLAKTRGAENGNDPAPEATSPTRSEPPQ